MSGLKLRSGDGPYELNDEISPPVGLGMLTEALLQAMVVAPAAMRLFRVSPSAAEIETTGMVTAGEPATVGDTMPEMLL